MAIRQALNSSIQYLKGIGPKRAKLLNELGIFAVEDLFYHFPRRYQDRTKLVAISGLLEGEFQSIKAQVLAKGARSSWRRGGFSIFEMAVGDDTGKIHCVWFNQGYLKDYFNVGDTVYLYGRVERYGSRLQMNSPEFDLVQKGEEESIDSGRLVPVYTLPQGISQRYFRRIIKLVLDEFLPRLEEVLPYDIRARNNLLNSAKSILNIHFPENHELQKEAYRRLSFEEFFIFELPLALRKEKRKQKKGIAHRIEGGLADDFIGSLPFKLTGAQEKVLSEIKADMSRPLVMQRLLQGDVGSGKTVVAVIASLLAVEGGYQVAFMVPTEILARQHYSVVSSQLAVLSGKVKVGLLTSSLAKKEKEDIYRKIKRGDIDLLIGTHALLEEEVIFKKLGLVVIDEQHKFGVGQRALLPHKGLNPDVLIMTATPIPRTLAITLYADLDVSVIDMLPSGRLEVKTEILPGCARSRAYGFIKEQLRTGHQAYIVYPVIEESYALDLSGAKKMHEELAAGEFSDFKLGLIHGRLKHLEQDSIMSRFERRELDILIATTVLEVGIDVPAATCMLIERAERFGLAQLHQLRGRVGRGSVQSFCFLISEARTPEAKMRMEAMAKYSDGFHVAEEDLKIRGPGEFFGERQHGLTELKIANPLTQLHLLKSARDEAIRLVGQDPSLAMRQNLALKEKLLQRFPEYENLMVVG